MKNLKKITILLLATMLCVSCGSNDDLPSSGDEFLTAKVDGVDFSSFEDSIGASIGSGGAGDILVVQGSNASGDYINFSLTGYTGTGTYTTGDGITNLSSIRYGTVQPLANWTSTFDLGSGTIEITFDSSNTIEGTFTFTGVNNSDNTSKTITEGKFKAEKQ